MPAAAGAGAPGFLVERGKTDIMTWIGPDLRVFLHRGVKHEIRIEGYWKDRPPVAE